MHLKTVTCYTIFITQAPLRPAYCQSHIIAVHSLSKSTSSPWNTFHRMSFSKLFASELIVCLRILQYFIAFLLLLNGLSYPLRMTFPLVLTNLPYFHCSSSSQISFSVQHVTLPSSGDSSHILTSTSKLRSCFSQVIGTFRAFKLEMTRSSLLIDGPRKLCIILQNGFSSLHF